MQGLGLRKLDIEVGVNLPGMAYELFHVIDIHNIWVIFS